jgi:hypothetical protein
MNALSTGNAGKRIVVFGWSNQFHKRTNGCFDAGKTAVHPWNSYNHQPSENLIIELES